MQLQVKQLAGNYGALTQEKCVHNTVPQPYSVWHITSSNWAFTMCSWQTIPNCSTTILLLSVNLISMLNSIECTSESWQVFSMGYFEPQTCPSETT